MKKIIRLTESDLHRIIENSINTVLNEIGDTDSGKDAIAQVQGRAAARIMKDPSHAAKYQKTYNDAENRLKGQKNGKGFQKGFQKGIKEAKNDDIENGIDNDFDLYNDDGTYDYTETPDYDSLYGDMSDDDMQQYMDDADADRFINNDAYDDGESSLYDYQ